MKKFFWITSIFLVVLVSIFLDLIGAWGIDLVVSAKSISTSSERIIATNGWIQRSLIQHYHIGLYFSIISTLLSNVFLGLIAVKHVLDNQEVGGGF